MPPWLVVALVVAFVASRPVEARLWRAGRLSDRTTTVLMLGRLSALALLACVAQGAAPVYGVGIVALSLLPVAIFYRFFVRFLSQQRPER